MFKDESHKSHKSNWETETSPPQENITSYKGHLGMGPGSSTALGQKKEG